MSTQTQYINLLFITLGGHQPRLKAHLQDVSPPEPTSHQLSLISHYTFVNPVRFLHVLV